MPPQIIGAVIGIFAFVCGAIANWLFGSLQEKRKETRLLRDKATFISSEIKSIAQHYKANRIKLNSMLKSKKLGDSLDYKKFSYSSSGFIAVNLSDINGIHESIALDILRLSIFIRNNEIHVGRLEEIVFGAGQFSDDDKWVAVKDFDKRMEISIGFCEAIANNLAAYAQAPTDSNAKKIDWPDDTFALKTAASN